MASKTDRLCDVIDANGLARDATLRALADPRCRTVLERLVRQNAPAELTELTPCLSSEADELDGREALRLHHVVLPKLDDVGLVTYDWNANVVDLDASDQRVKEYLDRMSALDGKSTQDGKSGVDETDAVERQ